MKNLEQLTDYAIQVINETCGYPEFTKLERPLTINYRAKTRFGQCTTWSKSNRSKIEIASRILDDSIPDEKTLSVIIHELLHAVKGGQDHTGIWKTYANMINRKYPQYRIERTLPSSYFGLERDKSLQKYGIQCQTCHCIHYSSKLSKSIQHPEMYQCRCGGKLIRIK